MDYIMACFRGNMGEYLGNNYLQLSSKVLAKSISRSPSEMEARVGFQAKKHRTEKHKSNI